MSGEHRLHLAGLRPPRHPFPDQLLALAEQVIE
jgi:hypothetical protein